MKHHLSLPPGQLQVHLTRDEADAARLTAGPQAFSGPEGIERSWGSLEELLDGTRLPPYPRTVLKRMAASRERESLRQTDAASEWENGSWLSAAAVGCTIAPGLPNLR